MFSGKNDEKKELSLHLGTDSENTKIQKEGILSCSRNVYKHFILEGPQIKLVPLIYKN